MKLIYNKDLGNCKEIEIEHSFLWIKWRVKYRKYCDALVFRFKSPNYFYQLGFSEYLSVKNLFEINP